jgi:glycosyltransferase involved in cell wall biosynthesis
MRDAGAPVAITHVSPFGEYADRIVFSGAENHLFQLMAGQRDAGHDVELLMLVVQDGPRLRQKAEELAASGFRVTRLVYSRSMVPLLGRGAWVLQLPRLRSLLAGRRNRIIHTHQPHASQLGRLAAWLGGARAIVDSVHNDEPFFARRSWRLRLKALQRITGHSIAISTRVKTHLVDNVGLDAGRIEIIPYGIDPPAVSDRAAARAELGLPPDAFVVGFVGRLTAQKDLPVLLAAMAQVPDAHLSLVGAGEDEMALRDELKRLNLKNVHFHGARGNGAELIAAFDVFALSSKWEGLGLVLLEAMASGVPITATRGGAIPEVLADGELGLLSEVGDAKGLAENIMRLKGDAALREKLVAAGRNAIRVRYSVTAMTERTTWVYRKVLAGVRTGGPGDVP